MLDPSAVEKLDLEWSSLWEETVVYVAEGDVWFYCLTYHPPKLGAIGMKHRVKKKLHTVYCCTTTYVQYSGTSLK